MWSKKTGTEVVQNFMKQLMVMVLMLLLSFGAHAQAELDADLKAVTKDGRQVRLNRDYTWEFIEFVAGDPANSAVLTVTQVWEMQDACKLQFRLQNNLGYKIHALVPRFAILNNEGIVYDSPSISFTSIMPTKNKYTEIQISGIGCHEISHLKVIDAARCRMGELDQWNEEDGECLGHIYVEPSQEINVSK
jgi:Protein of unknown function (DUF3157)